MLIPGLPLVEQSELIIQLESENILQLLLAMAAQADSTDYAPWNMVVLDILHLVFRGVKPDELMVPVQKVSRLRLCSNPRHRDFDGISRGQIEGNRLKDMLDLEARQTTDLFGLKGSRHSRFGTTIAVKSGVSASFSQRAQRPSSYQGLPWVQIL